MAVFVRSGPLTFLTKSSIKSSVLIQKAFLKNEALTFAIRKKNLPQKDVSDIRFPKNTKWGEDFTWSQTSCFHRKIAAYQVPDDVDDQLNTVLDRVLGTGEYSDTTKLRDLRQIAAVLTACQRQLQHAVPNYMLHFIKTIGDVRRFYRCPVDRSFPLEKLSDQQLPANLSVLSEYTRFHPETDTKFDGVSAFPHTSTVVTGIKNKNKYKGYNVRTPLPWDNKF